MLGEWLLVRKMLMSQTTDLRNGLTNRTVLFIGSLIYDFKWFEVIFSNMRH